MAPTTSPPRERDVREAMLRYAHLLHTQGWVANHDGNLTARLAKSRILATPTATSKADVDDESLIVVNERGERLHGSRSPFGELVLHLAIYEARPDINAVIHTHSPYATAMASAGKAIGCPFIAEAVVSLGPDIPLLPFVAPKTPDFVGALKPYLPAYDAVMLGNHGVLAWGESLEQAYLRAELVEHLAKIATLAQAWGGPKPLPVECIGALLDARKKAGLGPASRGLAEIAPPHTAPSPAAKTSSGTFGDDLTRIITEEIAAALSGR
jgi:L-fuculose-phosphate aldolase